jgi:hypothetical protein
LLADSQIFHEAFIAGTHALPMKHLFKNIVVVAQGVTERSKLPAVAAR